MSIERCSRCAVSVNLDYDDGELMKYNKHTNKSYCAECVASNALLLEPAHIQDQAECFTNKGV